MAFFSFFKKTISNIFINADEKKYIETAGGEVDYILSRSLYASIPTNDASYYEYSLGNYCIKTYIDTLSSFISIPYIKGSDEDFTSDFNAFLRRNQSELIKIYRSSMIDGLIYVWAHLEREEGGKLLIKIKSVPRENVKLTECIKSRNGFFEKVVIEKKESWKEEKTRGEGDGERSGEIVEKKCIIKITITPNIEVKEIIGALPPGHKERREVSNTGLFFVPIFVFYNNKLSFFPDGLPECTSLLPFIKKYNETFNKLNTHLKNILDPKLKLKLKSASNFLKSSLGIREKDYKAIESGEYKPDVTQFKVAILQDEKEDVEFINQRDNIKSALDVLNLIHWIIVELTMPEYLYGTALNTTNASVKEQSPVWTRKIEDRRAEYSHFYYWLINCFFHYSKAINGRLIYNEDPNIANDISIEWEEIEAKDDVALMNALQSLTESIIKALDATLISPETAFNTLKNFVSIPNSWKEEHEKAINYAKEKIALETLKNSGGIF